MASAKTPSSIIIIFFFLLISLFSFRSVSQPNSTQPILYDIFPFIRVYTNGTVQRFIGQDFAPPSPTAAAAVRSKDIKFSKKLNLSARIYLPRSDPARKSQKLPLLIYFHGGGFFTESAFSPTYHNHLNLLVARSRVAAVSVNYRLAPENPLPTAYGDSWLALKWSLSHSHGNGTEPWLTDYADFRRVYLGGDSAGANIAHNMAMRVGSDNLGIRISGIFLNCPYFLGKRAIGNESASAYAYVENQMQKLWLYAYPDSRSGLDDPLVNPGMDPGLGRLGCERVLVFVGGNDVLRFRGRYYAGALRKSGWKGEVRVVEFGGENHVFNLAKPKSPKAIQMLRILAYFLNH